MTRCMRNKVNLKSSTYNQTGQRYYEQLAAYNSMSIHLRRILLAKSVVDTRNKNYLKKKQQCKVQETSDKRACSCPETIDDVINKLTYDTLHHPVDILRMNLNPKHLECCNYNLDRLQSRTCSGRTYYEENDRIAHRSTSKNRRTVSPVTICSSKRKKFTPNSVSGKGWKYVRETPRIIGPSTCYSQRRKCRYEKDTIFVPDTTTTLNSSMFKSGSQSVMQETNDRHSISSNTSQCYDYDCDDQSVESKLVSKQFLSQKHLSQKEEEKKYIKFIYDITKEIIQRGLYTDQELQNVFKKHIDRYKGILNMNKMLYEIYQLKISLNMTDDTDDELEDLIHAQKLLTVSEIRPPTPPKVLNDNKIMEKLESYRKMTEKSRSQRTVTLVDANPDLFVTERDVLMSLVEVGIDPKQVQHICKNLRHKSRVDMMQTTDAEAYPSYPLDLEIDNLEELQDNDKQVSPKVETAESARNSIDNSPKSLEKQEANSSNLVSEQQETVEVEEKVESEIILENDKMDS